MQEIDILQKQIASQQKLLTSTATTTTTTTTTEPQICLSGWQCRNPNYKGYQFEDCSWIDLTYCEHGCENGECITSTTTPTPTPTPTTKPSYCHTLCDSPCPFRYRTVYSKECGCYCRDYSGQRELPNQ